MNNKIKSFLKIAFAIGMSLLITILLSKEIFMENTPMIRKDIASRVSKTLIALSGGKKTNAEDGLKDLPLLPISKGVYAKENTKVRYTLMKLNEMEMIEYRFTIKGKEMIIHIPKDQSPPPESVLEKLQ